ncbi:MAG: hypothetical protein ACMUEL_07850 [Flavobacteriales bacterium Tduv]
MIVDCQYYSDSLCSKGSSYLRSVGSERRVAKANQSKKSKGKKRN